MPDVKRSTEEVDSELGGPLSPSEDDELRQLTWFSMVGQLSETAQERILELRARDRRSNVRNPRPDPSATRTADTPATATGFEERSEGSPVLKCPNCGFLQRPKAQPPNR
jgi:hypothetical protein